MSEGGWGGLCVLSSVRNHCVDFVNLCAERAQPHLLLVGDVLGVALLPRLRHGDVNVCVNEQVKRALRCKGTTGRTDKRLGGGGER